MENRQPSDSKDLIDKPVSLLSILPLMARVIQPNRQDRLHCLGITEDKINMLALDPIPGCQITMGLPDKKESS